MTGLLAVRAAVVIWSCRKPLALGLLGAFLLPLLLLPIALTTVVPAAPPARTLHPPVATATMTQPFGCTTVVQEPWSPECPTDLPRFHSGIDLAAAEGTQVFAAESGWASLAYNPGGYGRFVVITHGARLSTLYGHLQSALVGAGEWVRAGQPIGLMGSTGNSTGPHLHFEVRLGGVPVDPVPYVRAGQ